MIIKLDYKIYIYILLLEKLKNNLENMRLTILIKSTLIYNYNKVI